MFTKVIINKHIDESNEQTTNVIIEKLKIIHYNQHNTKSLILINLFKQINTCQCYKDIESVIYILSWYNLKIDFNKCVLLNQNITKLCQIYLLYYDENELDTNFLHIPTLERILKILSQENLISSSQTPWKDYMRQIFKNDLMINNAFNYKLSVDEIKQYIMLMTCLHFAPCIRDTYLFYYQLGCHLPHLYNQLIDWKCIRWVKTLWFPWCFIQCKDTLYIGMTPQLQKHQVLEIISDTINWVDVVLKYRRYVSHWDDYKDPIPSDSSIARIYMTYYGICDVNIFNHIQNFIS